MRKWHVLRDNKKTVTPTRVLFFDTETKTTDSGFEQLKLGCAVFVNLAKKLRKTCVFEKPKEFYDFVFSNIYDKETVYIFAHNMAFDFFIVDSFKFLSEAGYELVSFVNNPTVFIAKFRNKKKTLVYLDTFNWFKSSIEQIGKDVGLPKRKINFKKATKQQLADYCMRDVEIIEKCVVEYLKFLREHDLGTFRYTIAGQGLQAFKHRFKPKDVNIVLHDNPDALRLERESYRGGRNCCYALGKLPNKLYYKLDVNSGYPFVMKYFKYPTRLISVKYLSIDMLRKILQNENRCVIARAVIKLSEDALGVRLGNQLVFPTGEIAGTFTTEELKYALEHGEIVHVGEAAIYEAHNIFEDYISFFYSLKLKYEREGNKTYRLFAKYFMNCLSGKFGQQIPKNQVKLINYYAQPQYVHYYDLDAKKHVRRLAFGHRVITFSTEKKEGYDSFPSISSHITANMRLYLYRLQKLVLDGGGDVYYTDTDSLITDKQGYKILAQEPFMVINRKLEPFIGENLGQLKIEGIARKVVLHGLKDYVFGKEVKIKGIRKDAVQLSEVMFEQTIFPTVKTMLKDGGVKIKKVIKQLKRDYKKGRVIPTRENYAVVVPYEM